MKRVIQILSVTSYLLIHVNISAQTIAPAILQQQWKAAWITVQGEHNNSYGVYIFRKVIDLQTKPSTYIIHVSADNRYKLFVNEKLVSLGPARGDLTHWNFETVDLAPYLQAGKNIVAAKVWNEAEWRPEAQISLGAGFIIQGNTAKEQAVNSDTSWRCVRDSSYQPIKISIPTYYVAGPGEQINMNNHISKWQTINYNDSAWKKPQQLSQGLPKGMLGQYGTISGWMLVPSGIPQMELTQQRLIKLRKANGVSVPANFPAQKSGFIIPANTTATLLLDQTFLTNAYPTLLFSGGKNSTITLSYAESLFTKYPDKGQRDSIDNKIIVGRYDSLISNGTNGQEFTSLAWRTYRYIQLHIVTTQDALTIDDMYGTFTGYPFERKAKFESDDIELAKMLDIGWRTARLCAVETYMDCPYFEQLQYIGDSRIQGIISVYNSGDDRLLKHALNQMDNSRQPEGVTLSRHPSYTPQYIPTFSLWYIGLLHDYLMYGSDSNFIKDKLHGEREVLNYFRSFQQPDGSLKNVPHWMFTDWVEAKDWSSGVAPMSKDGSSALLDLQLLWAYQVGADLENRTGLKTYASLYNSYAGQLKKIILQKYWDNNKKLFADRLEKDVFSQHANILAILTGVVDKKDVQTLAKKIINDTSLAPASIYFKYYLHLALTKAGLGNDYISWLDKWRENIKMGLTTWAEMSDVSSSRSDCHAWGASPNIEFFRTVLGIGSDSPGFTKVRIEPHLGALKNAGGEIPHPQGKISTSYKLDNNKWNIVINLPGKVTGFLIWKEKIYLLKPGKNNFAL